MISQKAKKVLEALEASGYEAYIVGGAVRDIVLGKEPHDWDITTNATPEQTKKVFKKTIDSGIEFGTVTAVVDDEEFEITTYRTDGNYSDNRKPDKITFATTIEEDLKRRDFTINAMACDKNGNIIDPFNGRNDIKNGVIRAVGNPDKRIREDALRMMRAVRFAAKYGFDIDDKLYQAIKTHAEKIKRVSMERISSETSKIITSDHPEFFLELYKLRNYQTCYA